MMKTTMIFVDLMVEIAANQIQKMDGISIAFCANVWNPNQVSETLLYDHVF